MIHGLRNDKNGAVEKIILAKNRLKKLGYAYPVIGFSYDSNTKGEHFVLAKKLQNKMGIIFHNLLLILRKKTQLLRLD